MERIGAELAAIQRIALDADQPEAAAALLGALRRTLEKKLGAAEESGAGCAAAAAPPVCSRQHLLFLVHGIGRHDDFIDGKNLSWDGQPDGKGDGPGGNREFRELIEAQLRTRLRGIKAEEGKAERRSDSGRVIHCASSSVRRR
mmetsp:Transcript_13104/g.44065  ORF Transcript_13104/g.44065 Transcript_13104/m.44065 type:complete len:144 (+) Transcript_13104:65-496(+)